MKIPKSHGYMLGGELKSTTIRGQHEHLRHARPGASTIQPSSRLTSEHTAAYS
jgi:hypothetical protein